MSGRPRASIDLFAECKGHCYTDTTKAESVRSLVVDTGENIGIIFTRQSYVSLVCIARVTSAANFNASEGRLSALCGQFPPGVHQLAGNNFPARYS